MALQKSFYTYLCTSAQCISLYSESRLLFRYTSYFCVGANTIGTFYPEKNPQKLTIFSNVILYYYNNFYLDTELKLYILR